MNKFTDPLNQINDSVINKYKMAGKLCKSVIEQIISKLNVMNVKDLCLFGDGLLGKQMAFPTTISVNEIVSNFRGDYMIKTGDLVKIELGAMFDGYPVNLCHTIEYGGENKNPFIRSINKLTKRVIKKLRVGYTNMDVIEILSGVSDMIPSIKDVRYLDIAPGINTYQISRNVLFGLNDDEVEDELVHKQILHKYQEHYPYSMMESEFCENEVYLVDLVLCEGGSELSVCGESNIYGLKIGKPKVNLKLDASRYARGALSHFPKAIDGNNKFKLGIKECISKGVANSWPVFKVGGGVSVRVKFVAIITDKDPIIIGL